MFVGYDYFFSFKLFLCGICSYLTISLFCFTVTFYIFRILAFLNAIYTTNIFSQTVIHPLTVTGFLSKHMFSLRILLFGILLQSALPNPELFKIQRSK